MIPGGETTVYRYGERERYYQTVRWQKPEPGAWRGTRSEYKVYIEYRDPKGYRKADNIKNAYTCETHRESRFYLNHRGRLVSGCVSEYSRRPLPGDKGSPGDDGIYPRPRPLVSHHVLANT